MCYAALSLLLLSHIKQLCLHSLIIDAVRIALNAAAFVFADLALACLDFSHGSLVNAAYESTSQLERNNKFVEKGGAAFR